MKKQNKINNSVYNKILKEVYLTSGTPNIDYKNVKNESTLSELGIMIALNKNK